MTGAQPLNVVWWLVSRAAGIVALVLISVAVVLGLTLAAKILRRPPLRRAAARLHEHVALVALAAVGVHGLALLGDRWLRPGWRGITVPFALAYRPGWTGAGIIAGYLAVLLGPSFFLRRRIGARRWRSLHRATLVVWLLSTAHGLGAGSDGGRLWLRVIVLAPVAPIAYLLVVRMAGSERPARSPKRGRAAGAAGPSRRPPARRPRPHRAAELEVTSDLPGP